MSKNIGTHIGHKNGTINNLKLLSDDEQRNMNPNETAPIRYNSYNE